VSVVTARKPASNDLSVGSTSRWTAAVRANETARSRSLLNDPWAAALAGAEGKAWVKQWPVGEVQIVLRTRYFDDFLNLATTGAGLRQVVLVAAGLDTRAFRLDWPADTRLFELDQPSVLQHKETVLAAAGAVPRCTRHVIGADLRHPWAERLAAAGFDPALPSAWLLEGFLYYLDNPSGRKLLGELSALSAPGSVLAFDTMNARMLTSPLTRSWIQMQARSGAPWLGTMDDPCGLLSGMGWSARMTQAGQPDAHHGRWPYPVVHPRMPFVPHNWFVTASRAAA
jgi:methyltransferase (TIGR00027 family)